STGAPEERTWTGIELAAEAAPEVREVGEAEPGGDIGNAHAGRAEQPSRSLHPSGHHVGMRGQARRGAEQALEVERAHGRDFRHFPQARWPLEHALDVLRHAHKAPLVQPTTRPAGAAGPEIDNGDVQQQTVDDAVGLALLNHGPAERRHPEAGACGPDYRIAARLQEVGTLAPVDP